MLMIAVAGFIVVEHHAQLIDDQSQPIFVKVIAACCRFGKFPGDRLDESIYPGVNSFVEQIPCLHVGDVTNIPWVSITPTGCILWDLHPTGADAD